MRLPRTIAILSLTGFCSMLLAAGNRSDLPQKGITYTKDVAPILNKNCVLCHRPNDVAPMSLMTYEDVLPFARMIQQDVLQRKMPPWHADPNVGEFINDARLSDAEISTIDAWVKGGTKKGDLKDLPPAPVFEAGWHIKPDAVFTIPKFLVPRTAQDDYEYIYVPTNFTEDKWIQAGEVLPGDRRVVHHATVSVVDQADYAKRVAEQAKEDNGVDKYHYRTGKVLHLRPEAPVIDDGCSAPDGGAVPGESSGYLNIVPAIYLPGHMPEVRPPGYAPRIPAGSYLQFQIHYSNHRGIDMKDHTSIGLVFAKEPVKHEGAQYEIWNDMFQIPANDPDHH